MLSLDDVSVFYGKVQALRAISLSVPQGKIVTLIGANGAGKTTTMMTISGNPHPREGRITFQGHDITALPTHRIIRLGLAHVPEGRHIFPRMSVQENLLLGAPDHAAYARERDRVFHLFPKLADRAKQMGGTLSGGEQQMLAIARALMASPQLLLLDEPSLGLAPLMAKQIFEALQALNRDMGLTILLVEQNAYQALRMADWGYVLVNGQITLQGPAAELLAAPEIQKAYLGH